MILEILKERDNNKAIYVNKYEYSLYVDFLKSFKGVGKLSKTLFYNGTKLIIK